MPQAPKRTPAAMSAEALRIAERTIVEIERRHVAAALDGGAADGARGAQASWIAAMSKSVIAKLHDRSAVSARARERAPASAPRRRARVSAYVSPGALYPHAHTARLSRSRRRRPRS